MPSLTLAVVFLILSCSCRGAEVISLSILVDLHVGSDGCPEPPAVETSDISCDSLQRMLEFVANMNEVDAGNDSYVEIRIAEGHYEVVESVRIERNIVIRAETPGTEVMVTFDSLTLQNTAGLEYHAILIENVSFARIEGIRFESSQGVITFENVERVSVSNSNFSYFANGALDIYMCFQVNIFNCTFEHNGPVNITKLDRYRGSAAGVSIGYNDTNGTLPESVLDDGGYVNIAGCVFRHNEQRPLPEDEISVHEFLDSYRFAGRGGALCLTVNSTFTFDAYISDCIVEDSYAKSLGGGFYIAYSGYHEHLILINNSMFVNGYAEDFGGGGLFAGFVEAGRPRSYSVHLDVFNSNFTNNRAIFGGAIFFQAGPFITSTGELTNNIYMANSTFEANLAEEYGAALCTSALLFFVPTFNLVPIIIKDSTFDGNYAIGRGGVLSTAYVPISFIGKVKFRRNIGRSLVVIGTKVEVNGSMLFYGNGITDNSSSVIDAGAVYLTSFAQIVLSAGARINFINNTGVLGAALVVDYLIQSNLSRIYLQTVYNPLCPIRSVNSTMRPDNWKDVNITFHGNRALAGSAIFLNGIHSCAWTGERDGGDVNLERSLRWNFIHFGTNYNTIHRGLETNSTWYVQTPAKSIQVANNVSAFLGEEYRVNALGRDELNEVTAAVLQLSDTHGLRSINFLPATGVPSKRDQDFSIITKSLSRYSTPDILEEPRRILVTSLLTTNVIHEYLYFTPERCPAGYILTGAPDRVGFDCECNSMNDSRIASCEGRTILFTSALWGASIEAPGKTSNSLATYPCPFHYCDCVGNGSSCMFMFDEKDPNSQCHCARNGILCGQCTEGLGFTVLLNRCDRCSPFNILWLLALTFAAALFIGLFLAAKWAPLDWFYPAIFYVQIVPTMAFFFPPSFEVVHPYPLYVGSALSFYYCYDFCIFPGFYAELSYLMKFLPFFITILLCIVVGFIRRYHGLHRQSWHGLWWVIILQYTHVVHTAMTALACPQLPDNESVMESRWIVNANVQCFRNLHLLVAIVSIVSLVFCVSIIPIIFVYSCGYLEKPVTIHKTFTELAASFKDNCPWWPAAELLRRFILILVIVAFPGNDYPTIFYLAITVTISTFLQPFKHAVSNVVEILLTVDALVLLLIRNTGAFSFGEGMGSTSVPMRMEDMECTFDDLSFKNSVTVQVYVLIPFYYVPMVAVFSTVVAFIIYSIRIFVKKRKLLRENNDIEALSYAYETGNNPTTTYLASFSGRHKVKTKRTRFNNSRYLHFGWTRRPQGELEQRRQRYMKRKKGQSMLELNVRQKRSSNPLRPVAGDNDELNQSAPDSPTSPEATPNPLPTANPLAPVAAVNPMAISKSDHKATGSSTLPQKLGQRLTSKSSVKVKHTWKSVPTKRYKHNQNIRLTEVLPVSDQSSTDHNTSEL